MLCGGWNRSQGSVYGKIVAEEASGPGAPLGWAGELGIKYFNKKAPGFKMYRFVALAGSTRGLQVELYRDFDPAENKLGKACRDPAMEGDRVLGASTATDAAQNLVVFNFTGRTLVTAFAFCTSSAAEDADPLDFRFEGSNNGKNWCTLSATSAAKMPRKGLRSHIFELEEPEDSYVLKRPDARLEVGGSGFVSFSVGKLFGTYFNAHIPFTPCLFEAGLDLTASASLAFNTRLLTNTHASSTVPITFNARAFIGVNFSMQREVYLWTRAGVNLYALQKLYTAEIRARLSSAPLEGEELTDEQAAFLAEQGLDPTELVDDGLLVSSINPDTGAGAEAQVAGEAEAKRLKRAGRRVKASLSKAKQGLRNLSNSLYKKLQKVECFSNFSIAAEAYGEVVMTLDDLGPNKTATLDIFVMARLNAKFLGFLSLPVEFSIRPYKEPFSLFDWPARGEDAPVDDEVAIAACGESAECLAELAMESDAMPFKPVEAERNQGLLAADGPGRVSPCASVPIPVAPKVPKRFGGRRRLGRRHPSDPSCAEEYVDALAEDCPGDQADQCCCKVDHYFNLVSERCEPCDSNSASSFKLAELDALVDRKCHALGKAHPGLGKGDELPFCSTDTVGAEKTGACWSDCHRKLGDRLQIASACSEMRSSWPEDVRLFSCSDLTLRSKRRCPRGQRLLCVVDQPETVDVGVGLEL